MKNTPPLSVFVLACLLNLSSCGVLLYPERQGQPSGRIDPTVVILDGIGVFLFVIPGLVAFLIDFHQGTIYLPPGQGSQHERDAGPMIIRVEGEMNQENIEAAIARASGLRVELDGPHAKAVAIEKSALPVTVTALANLTL